MDATTSLSDQNESLSDVSKETSKPVERFSFSIENILKKPKRTVINVPEVRKRNISMDQTEDNWNDVNGEDQSDFMKALDLSKRLDDSELDQNDQQKQGPLLSSDNLRRKKWSQGLSNLVDKDLRTMEDPSEEIKDNRQSDLSDTVVNECFLPFSNVSGNETVNNLQRPVACLNNDFQKSHSFPFRGIPNNCSNLSNDPHPCLESNTLNENGRSNTLNENSRSNVYLRWYSYRNSNSNASNIRTKTSSLIARHRHRDADGTPSVATDQSADITACQISDLNKDMEVSESCLDDTLEDECGKICKFNA